MAKTPEGKVKDAVKDWVKRHGGYYHMTVTSGYGRSGAPDFLICIDGHFIGIETKAPGKRGNVTALQERCGAEILAAGGRWFVVDNPDQLELIALSLGIQEDE